MTLEGDNYKLGVVTGYLRIGASLAAVFLFLPLAISILTLAKYGDIAKVWSFSYYAVFFELGISKYFIINLARRKYRSGKIAAYRIGLEFSIFATFFSYLMALVIYKVTDPFANAAYVGDKFLLHLSALVTASTVYLMFRRSFFEGAGLLYIVNLVTAVQSVGNLVLVVMLSHITNDLRILSSSMILLNFVSILVLSMLWRRVAQTRATPARTLFRMLKNRRRSRIVIWSTLKKSLKLVLAGISGAAFEPILRAASTKALPSSEVFAVIDLGLRAGAAAVSIVNAVALPLLKIFSSMSTHSRQEIIGIANTACKISFLVFTGLSVSYTALGALGLTQSMFPFLESAEYFSVFSTVVLALAFHAVFQPYLSALLSLFAFFEIYTVRALQYGVLLLGFGIYASQGELILFPIGVSGAWVCGGPLYFIALKHRLGRS